MLASTAAAGVRCRAAKTVVALLLVLSTTTFPIAARAEQQRPLPVPSSGGICPSGFTYSPTSGYCVPNPGTRSNAVPKQGYAPCPPGWHESMQSYCVQERR
jgi:hypothetical protein